MTLQDRVTKGFLAGVSGGIAMNVINLASYYLNIASLRLLDWPSIIITGQRPASGLETIFALLTQLIFVGFLGIVFAYLISGLINSTNHLFKGALFGIIAWFAIYAFTFMAKVPALTPLDTGTAFTDFIGAIVYGLVLAQVLNRLDNMQKVN